MCGDVPLRGPFDAALPAPTGGLRPRPQPTGHGPWVMPAPQMAGGGGRSAIGGRIPAITRPVTAFLVGTGPTSFHVLTGHAPTKGTSLMAPDS
jgi:hypothetical protein